MMAAVLANMAATLTRPTLVPPKSVLIPPAPVKGGKTYLMRLALAAGETHTAQDLANAAKLSDTGKVYALLRDDVRHGRVTLTNGVYQKAEPRPVKLQINTTGAWRDVMRFDASDGDKVMNQAGAIYKHDSANDLRLRIITADTNLPLMTYKRSEGEWKSWGANT